MEEPLHLLSQHRKIKRMNIAKAHPTPILKSAQFAQVDPMNFPLILSLPHQYLAHTEFIPSHIALGILKMLIEYVGIAWAIVLIRTSLPALEIFFSFHPITLLKTLFLEILEGTDFWSTPYHG